MDRTLYGTRPQERLINLLNNKIQEPKELIENIKIDIKEFSSGVYQFDDITMVDVKYIG